MSYPSNLLKVITPIALAITLISCGGDSATFGKSSGEGGTTQSELAKSIELSASTRQLFSDGSVPIIITAIAKNENNNAISDAKVTFSVDKQATIIPDDEASGSVKTASLTPGTAENRTLTVTATSGSVSKSLTVDVVGTKVVIDGPSSITINKEVPFVLKLTNGADKPVTNENVELTSAAGNTIITESNYQTDENGEISFKLVGLQGGEDTLNVNVLGVSMKKEVVVSGDEFILTGSLKEISINNSEVIKLLWAKSGEPQKNTVITLSATRGIIKSNPKDSSTPSVNITTVTTDENGEATFRILSETAGSSIITATSSNGLSTALNTEFVATTPAYINTQADPTLIKPNGSSTIITRIRDINQNPVKNKTIDFRLKDTVNGVLSSSTAVTDSLGRASVSYTAGNSSSEKDGVEITTFIQGYEDISDVISLTVGSNALRIVLGHDHLQSSTDVFYVKNFGVIVTDSAGNPVTKQKVDFTIIPTDYAKGRMVWNGEVWVPEYSVQCPSEDANNNGKLDIGEDINRNGTLEPTHDAAVTGTGVTDENGRIVIEVVFPKSRALWSLQKITSSVVVDGTEFIEQTKFRLPILAGDVGDEEVTPPNYLNPYGTSDRCDTVDGGITKIITSTIVDAITGAIVPFLKNNKWYKINFVDNKGNVTNESFTIVPDSGLFGKASVELGPNNSFRIIDGDIAVNSSGFFFTLRSLGIDKPLYYQDDSAIITPPEPTDTTPPILTMNGLDTMVITVDPLGAPFTDPGANAVDEKDGVVNVIVIGNVKTDIVGTYTLIYKATDSDGNSITRTRTVIVLP